MKRRTFLQPVLLSAFLVFSGALGFLADEAEAAWIWTPLTRRWINPKYAAKDSPSAQMDWAVNYFEDKDYPKAAREFLKLVQTYPRSQLAPEAQYLAGVSYELMDRPEKAFSAYRKIAEIYPFSARFKDAIEREYHLAQALASGKRIKWVGPVSFPSLDKAIEIYQHVVDHAPYGSFAAMAQYQLGDCYLRQERTEEASRAFQKVVDEYPSSPLVEEARFKIATCAYQLSLKPSYDQSATDEAIRWYEAFLQEHPESPLVPEAKASLARLKEIRAQGLLRIAAFYEKQGKPISAAVYYQQILRDYPDSTQAPSALAKIREFEQKGLLRQ